MEGFGMWQAGATETPVALTGVRMTARITAIGQRTVVEQVFVNKESQPIEAIYTFPLPDGAAVSGFEAITGERVLTGIIEELSKGIEKYDQAVTEGHGAFMAELWRPDVFSTRIGNLKPKQAVLIRLTYVSGVDISERKLRASFPTTLAPRYATATAMDAVDAAVDADALNPPHVFSVPYGLELSVEIDASLPLSSVGSPTHAVKVQHAPAPGRDLWKISLAAASAEMNRNVVIEADLAQVASASACIEDGLEPAEKFVAVTFLPEFDTTELAGVDPCEVVFVLDCSGSMNGDFIEQAKRALALCLKCLSEGDRFNICRFGSSYEFMQPESIPYTQRTLDAALSYLDTVQANLGGTELHAPLQAILAATDSRHVKEIILLTDGQVSNEPAIVQLAAGYRGRARIFSFGIGSASSEFLVRGIASATGGASTFIAPGERIEEQVLRMFARIASPRLDNIEVNWHGAEADMEPRQIGGLFDGEPLRASARIRGPVPSQVTLSAQWKGATKTWSVPVSAHSPRTSENHVGIVGASWARQRLVALELEDRSLAAGMSPAQRRDTIVQLSKRYGILSRETTLIAIEHRSLEERTKGQPALRRVPVMLAQGWGGTAVMDHLAAHPCAPTQAPCTAPPIGAPMPASPAKTLRRNAIGVASLSREWFKTSSSDTKAGKDALPEIRQRESAGDPLQKLLMNQTAEGSFAWDDLLTADQIAGKPWSPAAHRAKIGSLTTSRDKKQRMEILATALTLKLFQECFPDRRDLWTLAARKALRWLEKVAPEVRKLADLPAASII